MSFSPFVIRLRPLYTLPSNPRRRVPPTPVCSLQPRPLGAVAGPRPGPQPTSGLPEGWGGWAAGGGEGLLGPAPTKAQLPEGPQSHESAPPRSPQSWGPVCGPGLGVRDAHWATLPFIPVATAPGPCQRLYPGEDRASRWTCSLPIPCMSWATTQKASRPAPRGRLENSTAQAASSLEVARPPAAHARP